MANLLVVGSMNMDIYLRVKRHPQIGETVRAIHSNFASGGKGANQAVSAARLGASVAMIGAVGDDVFGPELRNKYAALGIDVAGVVVKEGMPTGIALITLNAAGENSIVVNPGANFALTADDVRMKGEKFQSIDGVILQNEIPASTNAAVFTRALELGIPIFYNPSPIEEYAIEFCAKSDYIVVNEYEATLLTGQTVEDDESGFCAAKLLLQGNVKAVVITRGEHGALCMTAQSETFVVPAMKVQVVDTTGAGDTFMGAFAAAVTEQLSLEKSLRFAVTASALSVTSAGAQSSMPHRSEVLSVLRNE